MARPKKSIVKLEESKAEVKEEPTFGATQDLTDKKDPIEKKTTQQIIAISLPSKNQLAKDMLKKLIAEETKTVKGRFRNYETPGGSLRVQVRKYPGIPDFDKIMFDNEMYEVPLYIARHLNGVDISAKAIDGKIHSCAFPTHGFKWDGDKPLPGSAQDDRGIPVPIIGVAKWNRRFGFESLEFDATA